MAIDDDLSKIGSIAHTSIIGNWCNRGEMVACHFVECPSCPMLTGFDR